MRSSEILKYIIPKNKKREFFTSNSVQKKNNSFDCCD